MFSTLLLNIYLFIFNNFDKYQYNFLFFSARPFVNYFVPNISHIYNISLIHAWFTCHLHSAIKDLF